jgi:hypothetical protein
MIRTHRFSSPALVAAFVALFALSGGIAVAATVLSKPLVTDPRDAGGKLDLRAARRIGKDRSCLMTISMWGSWSSTVLQGSNYVPGKNKLLVLYDLNGDNKPDLTGQVIFVSNRSLDLFVKASDGNLIGQATRTTSSSVAVQVCSPLLDLERIPPTVRVAFESVNRKHRDRMPNRGWIRLNVL